MDHTEILLTIGEISVTLAGFAGIVVLLMRRNAGRWIEADVTRFRAMIGCSRGSLVSSLFPLPLISAGVSESTTWASCSALLAAATSSMIVVGMRANIRYGWSTFNPYLTALVVGGSLLAAALLLLNALGVVFHQSFTGYLVGLIWLVALASILFARLVALGVRDRLDQ